jgi:hypothetical protein
LQLKASLGKKLRRQLAILKNKLNVVRHPCNSCCARGIGRRNAI